MRLACLASGSSGNATLVDTGSHYILIDCGLSAKETRNRLAVLNLLITDISAILLTHEHADHIGGAVAVANQSGASVYATRGTSLKLKGQKLKDQCQIIRAGQEFYIGETLVMPVAVPHDAREPVQFTLTNQKANLKVGVLTDLGSITPHVVEEFTGCQSLLVEANHCEELLRNGPYPAALKRRILGPWGHLSNTQTLDLLTRLLAVGSAPKNLIIGHISKENNQLDRVQNSLAELASNFDSLVLAAQDKVEPWVGIVE